jgi:hypothetical protein
MIPSLLPEFFKEILTCYQGSSSSTMTYCCECKSSELQKNAMKFAVCAVQDAVFQAAGAGQEQLGALDRFAKKRKLDT